MPIYEYRCDNGHTFEALQKFSDDAIESCEVCGAPAHRVLHPVAIHFKGSGFYNTDYGRGGKKKPAESRESKASESKSSDSKSSDSKKSDTTSSSSGSSSSSTKSSDS